MADSGYNTKVHGIQGGGYMVLGTDANGLPCILAAGQSNSDATIIAELGADTLYADGSLYISCVDGASGTWQKQNDVWVLNGVAA